MHKKGAIQEAQVQFLVYEYRLQAPFFIEHPRNSQAWKLKEHKKRVNGDLLTAERKIYKATVYHGHHSRTSESML